MSEETKRLEWTLPEGFENEGRPYKEWNVAHEFREARKQGYHCR